MNARQLDDRAEIQAYLETDRTYAAYALGDLDAGFFDKCTWHVAEQCGVIGALSLVYADFEPPILFLMGAREGVAELVRGAVWPVRAFVTAKEEHLAGLSRYYRWPHLDTMWRMALGPAEWATPARSVRRLDEDDLSGLRALYALGGGDAFNPDQLTQGVFYGIEQDGRLVSVAGTHLVSAAYGVGAVGNVMTHPAYRGRQYATLTTQAVCAELRQRGIGTIVLNVRQDNVAAVRVYEKLGFVRCCAYYEGMIEQIANTQ